jgi:hypothetical protein
VSGGEKSFFVSSFFFLKAREAAKSGLVLFHEAMSEFYPHSSLEEGFARFERAAAKGHEEAIWILSVVEGLEMEENVFQEAFAKTEEPLGWYLAGMHSYGQEEQFDFCKKSAEAGCSWGQVEYALFIGNENFEERDAEHLEWLKKAMEQNNPWAMHWLGNWSRLKGGNFTERAVSHFNAAAMLGWKDSMGFLAEMMSTGTGCPKDLSQAVIWSAKAGKQGQGRVFLELLEEVRGAFEFGITDLDFDRLCYNLGWGLYWYQYDVWKNLRPSRKAKIFRSRCLDYYCSCVELQQESIFTFLLCWNQTTGGMKDVGAMIGSMVWEGRQAKLLKKFEQKKDGWECVAF